MKQQTTHPWTAVGCVPAYGVKRLLGQRYHGRVIDPGAVYFWDGEYYPAAALQYDAGTNTATMPDGVVLPGGTALHLYQVAP